MRIKWSVIPNRVVIYGFLISLVIITIVPIYLIWGSSLKTNLELAKNGPLALPQTLHFENFVKAWNVAHFSVYARHSIIISSTTTLLVVVISVTAGYALALLSLPGAKAITVFLMLGLAIPYQGILIPIYHVVNTLNLTNSLLGVVLILAGLYGSFGTYLLRSFFAGISREIAEAAKMDGCNEWQTLWFILVPMAQPAIVTLAIFIFIWSWSELLVPLIFLQKDSLRTLSVGVTLFAGQYTNDYVLQAAGATMLSIPAIILYLIFQREFLRGISTGSLSGI
jgi:raffinose/stachyose/melibiose transport system permease protein